MNRIALSLILVPLCLCDCSHPAARAGKEPATAEFISHKITILKRVPGMSGEARAQAIAELEPYLYRRRVGGDVSTRGGMGGGVTFNDAFQKDFKTGVGIQYDIIIPAKAGGNVSSWLYLTSTSRAKKGVEAFLSYYGPTEAPKFKVFDWALKDTNPWKVETPYSTLKSKNWIFKQTYKGKSYDVIRVRSLTYQVSAKDWQNDVFLFSQKSGYWSRVHRLRYPATLAEQQSHWWGPIVETFQGSYTGTSEFGFLSTLFAARNSGIGPWSPSTWTTLGTKQSDQYGPDQGFNILNINPNYSWTAKAP